jgi:hypothetical protein
MIGFQTALFGIWNAAIAKMPPHIVGLADSLQNSAVSQKNVVWVGYDLLAVRTRRI